MPLLWQDRITVGLGLPSLEVERVEEDVKTVQVWAHSRQGVACCMGCGRVTDRIHSQWWTRIRDMPMFGKITYLHIHKRRFRCSHGCRPFLEDIPGLARYQRQTLRYQGHLEAACRSSAIAVVQRKETIGYKTLDRIYYHRAGAKADDFKQQPLPPIMGVDEFSGRRRVKMHMAITALGDKPRLWDVLPTKECNAFLDFFARYPREDRLQVQAIIHDMDLGINSWTTTMFPMAIHVIDPFHLVRCLLRHQERARKAAYQKSTSHKVKEHIRKVYWLIRRPQRKLTPEQMAQLDEVLALSVRLREAYEWKEAFMTWYRTKQRKHEAESGLYPLLDSLRQIPHLKRFGYTLTKWQELILNHFEQPTSNGFTEGMNNKIKTTKRLGYGQRNFDRFRIRILNECLRPAEIVV